MGTQVYEALGAAPKDAHALRWYNHIKSFGTGMKQFPKASSGFSLGGGAAPAAAAADDVKPWDDETDMDEMLKNVKSIEMDGLLWGASKLIPIGYGIKKLQVMCTVEDDKVSIEELS